MKALLIDDDQFVRMAFAMVLRDLGTEVLCAVHGEDAMRILEVEKVDWILCDINMPVMDGLEFGRLLRADSNWANIPLVFITGCQTREIGEKIAGLSGERVLLKPVSLEEIQTVVKHFEGRRAPGSCGRT